MDASASLPKTHTDVIELWPNQRMLADDINRWVRRGKKRVHHGDVRAWKYRGRIPPRWWDQVAAAAEARGYQGVTWTRLHEMSKTVAS